MPFLAPIVPALTAVGAIAGAASTIYSGIQQQKQAKKAASDASAQNTAAIQNVKDAQANASNQAQAILKKRAISATQTVYSSPLGISGQASTSKKMLTGQ